MSRCGWLVAFGLVLAAAGCRPPAPGPRNLVLTGAYPMAPLVEEAGKRFEETHPGVRVNVQPVGSERGISDTQQGLADVGLVARALRPDETTLRAFVLARDGVGFVVHRGNPVKALTSEQVVRLYTRGLTSWKLVGGDDRPITLVSYAETRSLLPFFLDQFKLKVGQVRADVLVNDSAQAVQAVADHPGALAYASVGPAEAAGTGGAPVRLLPWAGVPATLANVGNGSYPLWRPLNLVTRGPPQGLTQEFIEFAQSPAVQDLVEKYHYTRAPADQSPR
jgi:phosphate transport system substrate-binding protein